MSDESRLNSRDVFGASPPRRGPPLSVEDGVLLLAVPNLDRFDSSALAPLCSESERGSGTCRKAVLPEVLPGGLDDSGVGRSWSGACGDDVGGGGVGDWNRIRSRGRSSSPVDADCDWSSCLCEARSISFSRIRPTASVPTASVFDPRPHPSQDVPPAPLPLADAFAAPICFPFPCCCFFAFFAALFASALLRSHSPRYRSYPSRNAGLTRDEKMSSPRGFREGGIGGNGTGCRDEVELTTGKARVTASRDEDVEAVVGGIGSEEAVVGIGGREGKSIVRLEAVAEGDSGGDAIGDKGGEAGGDLNPFSDADEAEDAFEVWRDKGAPPPPPPLLAVQVEEAFERIDEVRDRGAPAPAAAAGFALNHLETEVNRDRLLVLR